MTKKIWHKEAGGGKEKWRGNWQKQHKTYDSFSTFRKVSGTKSAVHLVLLTTSGLAPTKYSHLPMLSLTMDCLFG